MIYRVHRLVYYYFAPVGNVEPPYRAPFRHPEFRAGPWWSHRAAWWSLVMEPPQRLWPATKTSFITNKTLLSPTVQMVFPGMGDTLPSDEDGALTRHFTASDGHSCIKKDEERRSELRRGSGSSRLMNQPMAPREGMVRDRRTTDFLIATERRSLGRTPLLLMNRDGVRWPSSQRENGPFRLVCPEGLCHSIRGPLMNFWNEYGMQFPYRICINLQHKQQFWISSSRGNPSNNFTKAFGFEYLMDICTRKLSIDQCFWEPLKIIWSMEPADMIPTYYNPWAPRCISSNPARRLPTEAAIQLDTACPSWGACDAGQYCAARCRSAEMELAEAIHPSGVSMPNLLIRSRARFRSVLLPNSSSQDGFDAETPHNWGFEAEAQVQEHVPCGRDCSTTHLFSSGTAPD